MHFQTASFRKLSNVFKLQKFLPAILAVTVLAPCVSYEPADAQVVKRKLPKAGFQSLMRPGPGAAGVGYSGQQMAPGSSGVHLVPGLDRGNRASAGDWYDPGEPDLKMQWVRWEPRKMPLRVWISPGLELPSLPFQELKATRVNTVAQMCFGADPNPFASLTQVNGWKDEMGEAVCAGIEMWKPFEQEGLFSFDFTGNPREANILVFFNDNFAGATEPGGISTGGYTCAQAIPFAKIAEALREGKNPRTPPVVMELSLGVNSTLEKLKAATAHEFGHALGIKAHSPYRDDIMHENRVVEQLSQADKNTIRRLYRSRTQWVL
ncbi:MAG TPA: matrixin family metalloprotease [Candidatus Melainabacteria bacterium]|nr:matrixin family metalloprotease [Candidatus Melainabacteria bacterium]HIN67565.1 matrixin family metalloprotease [Candidatus Obscuribacterales bacterium]